MDLHLGGNVEAPFKQQTCMDCTRQYESIRQISMLLSLIGRRDLIVVRLAGSIRTQEMEGKELRLFSCICEFVLQTKHFCTGIGERRC